MRLNGPPTPRFTLVAAFCYGLALVQAVRGAWSAEPSPADAERALAPVG